ncbi:hypothetical protein BJ508DRAFT_320439 [Ascobolus immersus RN42]|uniref:Uncharacterized protein n=1 Tax=Ascobolus immersus RN42 TaxID=1160509 RepID=A0A3N4ITA6_ASCIM|nr:hypothetical protein BJ508DRAFT_320439 [Ascobolus immersus RN42]
MGARSKLFFGASTEEARFAAYLRHTRSSSPSTLTTTTPLNDDTNTLVIPPGKRGVGRPRGPNRRPSSNKVSKSVSPSPSTYIHESPAETLSPYDEQKYLARLNARQVCRFALRDGDGSRLRVSKKKGEACGWFGWSKSAVWHHLLGHISPVDPYAEEEMAKGGKRDMPLRCGWVGCKWRVTTEEEKTRERLVGHVGRRHCGGVE